MNFDHFSLSLKKENILVV